MYLERQAIFLKKKKYHLTQLCFNHFPAQAVPQDQFHQDWERDPNISVFETTGDASVQHGWEGPGGQVTLRWVMFWESFPSSLRADDSTTGRLQIPEGWFLTQRAERKRDMVSAWSPSTNSSQTLATSTWLGGCLKTQTADPLPLDFIILWVWAGA